jgi:2-polyprenyl-3-methyl-5-hydroxy-6-metoxy-1,4-benzoquinol methylase
VVVDADERIASHNSFWEGLMSNSEEIPIQEQEQYWDMWQDDRSINSWAQRRSEIILQLLKSLELENPNIIDFGCGNGWFCPKLADYGKVTGIDLSRENMHKAQERFPNIEFIGADIFSHPLPAEHYDVVVSQQVIAHVSKQSEYVSKCAGLLKDGGHLILSTNNKIVMDRLGHEYVDDTKLGHLENWLSLRMLKQLLRPEFDLISHQSIIPRGHRGILRVVNSDKLSKIWSSLFGAASAQRFKEKLGLGYINIVLAKKR